MDNRLTKVIAVFLKNIQSGQPDEKELAKALGSEVSCPHCSTEFRLIDGQVEGTFTFACPHCRATVFFLQL